MKLGKAMLKGAEIVGAIVGMVVIVAWMSGMFHAKVAPGRMDAAPGEPLPEGARVAQPQTVRSAVFEDAVGTISAKRRTAVSAQIMATIKEINVRAGDLVTAGEALIVLDSRDIESRASQAAESLKAAEAVARNSKAEYERADSLFNSQTIGRSDFDRAQAAYDVAKADVERARRAVEEAKVGLSYALIKSPVSGRVVDRLAEPGDLASPGKPILNVYDPADLRLDASVRESLATFLKVGDPIEVQIDATRQTLSGRIEEIVPQAQAGARAFTVKVGLPSSEGLFAGMFGRLRIPVGERERLTLEAGAIERIGQLEYVRVVVDNRTQRRLVTTTPFGEGQVEVLSGLRAGEPVAVK